MPHTKQSDIRYKVLDRCLRRGGYSNKQLIAAINEELRLQGYRPVKALNTIQADKRHIEANYPHVHIVETRSGRERTYAYEDRNSSIYKSSFTDEETIQLIQCLSILSRFEGMPQLDWLQSFIDRARLTLDIAVSEKQVVGFDECHDLRGKEYFSTLLSAICRKRVLSIGYRSFKSDNDREVIIHPYYLKEYNRRWFLIGLVHGYESLTNLAFDRILYVNEVSGVSYIENNRYDFNDDYFSDIIGVSKHADASLDEVTIKVNNNVYPYIATKPLHKSQHVISQSDDSYIIGLNVCVNYELEQLLLSYGDEIEVLSPAYLRDKIRTRLIKSVTNYEEASGGR